MNWVLLIVVCGLTLILGAVLIPFRERKKVNFSEIQVPHVRGIRNRSSRAQAHGDPEKTSGSLTHVSPPKKRQR
jgi:hypothetical protein